MARFAWKPTLASLAVAASLTGTWALSRAQTPDRVITVGIAGKKHACKVIREWSVEGGGHAYVVRSQESGETLTLVREGSPDPATRETPVRIYRWVDAKAPQGAPTPPSDLLPTSAIVPKSVASAPPAVTPALATTPKETAPALPELPTLPPPAVAAPALPTVPMPQVALPAVPVEPKIELPAAPVALTPALPTLPTPPAPVVAAPKLPPAQPIAPPAPVVAPVAAVVPAPAAPKVALPASPAALTPALPTLPTPPAPVVAAPTLPAAQPIAPPAPVVAPVAAVVPAPAAPKMPVITNGPTGETLVINPPAVPTPALPKLPVSDPFGQAPWAAPERTTVQAPGRPTNDAVLPKLPDPKLVPALPTANVTPAPIPALPTANVTPAPIPAAPSLALPPAPTTTSTTIVAVPCPPNLPCPPNTTSIACPPNAPCETGKPTAVTVKETVVEVTPDGTPVAPRTGIAGKTDSAVCPPSTADACPPGSIDAPKAAAQGKLLNVRRITDAFTRPKTAGAVDRTRTLPDGAVVIGETPGMPWSPTVSAGHVDRTKVLGDEPIVSTQGSPEPWTPTALPQGQVDRTKINVAELRDPVIMPDDNARPVWLNPKSESDAIIPAGAVAPGRVPAPVTPISILQRRYPGVVDRTLTLDAKRKRADYPTNNPQADAETAKAQAAAKAAAQARATENAALAAQSAALPKIKGPAPTYGGSGVFSTTRLQEETAAFNRMKAGRSPAPNDGSVQLNAFTTIPPAPKAQPPVQLNAFTTVPGTGPQAAVPPGYPAMPSAVYVPSSPPQFAVPTAYAPLPGGVQQASYNLPVDTVPLVRPANAAMDRPAHVTTVNPAAGDLGTLAQLVRTIKESPHPYQREWAVNSLATFDWRVQPQVLAVLNHSAVTDPAGSVRAACVHTLSRMNVPATAFGNTLQTLRTDTDVRVRHEVDEVLRRVEGN